MKDKTLPWVKSLMHLGSSISSSIPCRMEQDLLEKRARYIARNNELEQEFFFAHPSTKIWINNVFNTCFYGAPLWDIFSKDCKTLENTWNISCRKMLSLPRTTHRYLIEPLTSTDHIIKAIKKRFKKVY